MLYVFVLGIVRFHVSNSSTPKETRPLSFFQCICACTLLSSPCNSFLRRILLLPRLARRRRRPRPNFVHKTNWLVCFLISLYRTIVRADWEVMNGPCCDANIGKICIYADNLLYFVMFHGVKSVQSSRSAWPFTDIAFPRQTTLFPPSVAINKRSVTFSEETVEEINQCRFWSSIIPRCKETVRFSAAAREPNGIVVQSENKFWSLPR